jgi:hypothetical protein
MTSPTQILFPAVPKQQYLRESWYLSTKSYDVTPQISIATKTLYLTHKEETTHSRTLSENLFFKLIKKTLEVSLPLTLQPTIGPYSEPKKDINQINVILSIQSQQTCFNIIRLSMIQFSKLSFSAKTPYICLLTQAVSYTHPTPPRPIHHHFIKVMILVRSIDHEARNCIIFFSLISFNGR